MVEEGKPAPDFELASDSGERVRLSGLRGRTVVLYFYPQDDTPGCTKQACSLRDAYGAIQERGATVLGAFMPSLDGIGRYFPLTLFACADEGAAIAPPELDPQDQWFEAA